MASVPLTASASFLVGHLREQDRQHQNDRIKELMRDKRQKDKS